MSAIKAEWKRSFHRDVLPVLVVAYVAITVYALFGGAWVCSYGLSGELAGFFPDPTFIGGGQSVLFVAPLAHALFFPIIATVVVGKLCKESLSSCACQISRARGEGCWKILLVRVFVSGVYLVGGFVAYSLLYALLLPALFGVALDADSWAKFIPRLLLSCVICLSFVFLVTCVVSEFGSGTFVLALVLFVTYVGYWIEFYAPGMSVPSHLACLMVVSGTGALEPSAVGIVVFCLAVCLLSCVSLLAAEKVKSLICMRRE